MYIPNYQEHPNYPDSKLPRASSLSKFEIIRSILIIQSSVYSVSNCYPNYPEQCIFEILSQPDRIFRTSQESVSESDWFRHWFLLTFKLHLQVQHQKSYRLSLTAPWKILSDSTLRKMPPPEISIQKVQIPFHKIQMNTKTQDSLGKKNSKHQGNCRGALQNNDCFFCMSRSNDISSTSIVPTVAVNYSYPDFRRRFIYGCLGRFFF